MVPVGIQSEFSRLVDVGQLPPSGFDMSIEADAAERAALCERFGLVALSGLHAQVRIERAVDQRGAEVLRVTGSFSADLTQTCVVALEAFEARVEERFELLLSPVGADAVLDDVVAFSFEERPEPIDGNDVDVGELVSEHLALSLDPYPRVPGTPTVEIEFPPSSARSDDGGGPFAALGQLKGKM